MGRYALHHVYSSDDCYFMGAFACADANCGSYGWCLPKKNKISKLSRDQANSVYSSVICCDPIRDDAVVLFGCTILYNSNRDARVGKCHAAADFMAIGKFSAYVR